MRTDEHAYIKIGKDLKAGRIPGLVVLQGEEEYLVHFYADLLMKKYVNEATKALDITVLDRETVTVSEIIENLETISLLSERKVVLIRDFIDAKGKYPKNLQPPKRNQIGGEGFQSFIDYVNGASGGIPDGALLLLTIARQEDDGPSAKRLVTDFDRTVSGKGNVYDFGPLDPAQLWGFIEKRFRAAGKQYRSPLISEIVQTCGYTNKNIDYGLYELENDLKKVIAHSGASPEITREDVVGVITMNPENDIFGMLDAVAGNHKDRALKLLHNLLEDGVNEFQILGMITGQLDLMLVTREMQEEGMSLPAIKEAMYKSDRTNEYRTERALRSARRFRTDDLKRILSSAYDVDMNIKSGLYDAKLALEMFVAGV
ncbi:MAG: DNA polymerase III subunit delta [Firmicutes bacterium]|nr:DNA polymerase III subunit delta [Bacillota bacterium]